MPISSRLGPSGSNAPSAQTGVPYQTIINVHLNQCAEEKKRLAFV